MGQEDAPYFPLFVNLSGKKIIVFGGGGIACRRIQTLLDFNSLLTVIAPRVHSDIYRLAEDKKLNLAEKSYEKGDCRGADLVLAATDSRSVNREIFMECNEYKIPVNVADCKEECDFYFPAIIKENFLVMGITASGNNHKLVKDTAEKLRNLKDKIFE